MKSFLIFAALSLITAPAFAEKIYPSNYTTQDKNFHAEGNKVYSEQELSGGNRVYTVEEHDEMVKEQASANKSWWSSGEKPTVTKKGNTTELRKVLNRAGVSKNISSAISGYNE